MTSSDFQNIAQTIPREPGIYKYYNKENERGILYNDPALAIDWTIPANKAVVSDKDKLLPLFSEYAGEFTFDQ